MNEDLIKTPRYKFFIGDEVFLKGKIVGFDVDENKFVENIVKLEYGQTLNVPNSNIYITDNITDKSKIKVTIPQSVADWIERSKQEKRNLRNALNNGGEKMRLWFLDQENYDLFGRAWLDGYEVEKEKRYLVKVKGVVCNSMVLKHNINEDTWYMSNKTNYTDLKSYHTRKELEGAGFGWVFDCPGIEIEEVE